MVPDEGFPLPVDVLGEVRHLWVGVFAHLVHGVTWKTEQLLWDWQGGKRTTDTTDTNINTKCLGAEHGA